MFAVVNIVPQKSKDSASVLNVEINRIVREIKNSGDIPDPEKYSTVTGVYKQSGEESFFVSENEYVIREIDEEDCRIITVKNSGCSLEENELAHIFDSFYRGSNVGSKSGNGLGLYICRQLTRKMGGDVFAEIENGYMCVSVVCKKK